MRKAESVSSRCWCLISLCVIHIPLWHKSSLSTISILQLAPLSSEVIGQSTYSTYSYDSTEQAVSRLAGDSSGYQVGSCARRRNAGARSISRQPECRSHRTSFHCPAQRWTQYLFTVEIGFYYTKNFIRTNCGYLLTIKSANARFADDIDFFTINGEFLFSIV